MTEHQTVVAVGDGVLDGATEQGIRQEFVFEWHTEDCLKLIREKDEEWVIIAADDGVIVLTASNVSERIPLADADCFERVQQFMEKVGFPYSMPPMP